MFVVYITHFCALPVKSLATMPILGNGLEDRQHTHGSQAAFRFSRFSKPYRSRLFAGLIDVNSFCITALNRSVKSLLTRPDLANEALGQYVMMKHQNGKKGDLSLVKHGLLACQHLEPRVKGRLVSAWENLRVWEEQRSTTLRPPLPTVIWCAMIGLARGHGLMSHEPEKRAEWMALAVLLELGFLCMLRPGELLKLRCADFALPGSFTLNHSKAAVRIISPKNRRQFGDQQFVHLSHPNTIAWLRCLPIDESDRLIWPSKPRRFGLLFKQLLRELKVHDRGFVPASLRPGGATMFFGNGIPVPSLRFMGRWTVEKSLEHYLQQATATQILNKLSEKAKSRLLKLGRLCLRLAPSPHCPVGLPILPKSRQPSGSVLVSWCNHYAQLACTTWEDKGPRGSFERRHL